MPGDFRILPKDDAVALPRFLAPPTPPAVRATASRTLPFRVLLRPCRSCRLRRLAPASVSRVSLNPARSWGSPPSELDLAKIVATSRRDIPSCDWHYEPACQRQPKLHDESLSPRCPIFRNARRRGRLSARRFRAFLSVHPSRFRIVDGLRKVRRIGSFDPLRPRFRGLIPSPVGKTSWHFCPFRPPGSPGFRSSLGPSPSLASASRAFGRDFPFGPSPGPMLRRTAFPFRAFALSGGLRRSASFQVLR